jgi:hypothetical protein
MVIATREEVEQFLSELHQKMKIRNIRYLRDGGRGKNTQTWFDLELTEIDLDKHIENLSVSHYSGCADGESMHGGTIMWVFGKVIKKHEIYIKITIGDFNKAPICISFHFSESPMTYPYQI